MIKYEIEGAMERPQNSKILILDSQNTYTISIPATKLPVAMKVIVLFGAFVVVAFFLIGLQFLIFHHSVVLDHSITESEFRAMPPASIGFYMFGWLMMTGLSAYMVAVAARTMSRNERVIMSKHSAVFQSKSIGSVTQNSARLIDIRDFHLRPDPTKMQSSKLLARFNHEMSAGGEEIEFALGITEIEKQWLASVMNVLLQRLRLLN